MPAGSGCRRRVYRSSVQGLQQPHSNTHFGDVAGPHILSGTVCCLSNVGFQRLARAAHLEFAFLAWSAGDTMMDFKSLSYDV